MPVWKMNIFIRRRRKNTGWNISNRRKCLTPAATDAVAGGVDAAGASGLPALTEIKELLESFREEMQLDRDIAGRQNMLSEQAAAEKAKLFEEILEEYM